MRPTTAGDTRERLVIGTRTCVCDARVLQIIDKGNETSERNSETRRVSYRFARRLTFPRSRRTSLANFSEVFRHGYTPCASDPVLSKSSGAKFHSIEDSAESNSSLAQNDLSGVNRRVNIVARDERVNLRLVFHLKLQRLQVENSPQVRARRSLMRFRPAAFSLRVNARLSPRVMATHSSGDFTARNLKNTLPRLLMFMTFARRATINLLTGGSHSLPLRCDVRFRKEKNQHLPIARLSRDGSKTPGHFRALDSARNVKNMIILLKVEP